MKKIQDVISKSRSVVLPEGTAKQKIDGILDRPDAPQLIPAIEPPVIYQLIKQAGFDEIDGLIPYMSPYQFQVCFDLDCWTGDRFNVGALLPWVHLLTTEAPDPEFRRFAREADPEMLAMLFQTNLKVDIFDDDGIVPNWMSHLAVERSPDGVYAIAYPEDELLGATLRRVLARLYELDRVLAWTLLEACRFEITSNMEEEAFRWRHARLEEFGFVSRDEAYEVYHVISPNYLRKQIDDKEVSKTEVLVQPDRLPVLPDVGSQTESMFFSAMMNTIEDQEHAERLVMEFASVQNRALIADGISPGDIEGARGAAERTLGYLSLGLEFLSRKDESVAQYILGNVPIRDILRTGFTLVWRLEQSIARLRNRPTLTLVDGERFSLLAEPNALLFDAVMRPRPQYFGQETFDIFHAQSQLDNSALRVAMVALKQLWCFSILGLQPHQLIQMAYDEKIVNAPIDVTFDVLFATRIALIHLGSDDLIRPLTMDEVKSIAGASYSGLNADALFGAGFTNSPTARLGERWYDVSMGRLTDGLGVITDFSNPELFTSYVLVAR